jgi:precorrin-8X/cobalt-precorrin-8 methylmutase
MKEQVVMQPHEIEQESLRIIRSELDAQSVGTQRSRLSEAEMAVVLRVIHATADFEFAQLLRFHPHAVAKGIAALRRGCTIVTDVHMVEAGITVGLLEHLGGEVICDIRDPDVVEIATAQGLTRACVSMRRNASQIQHNIVAIGNAPTALIEVIRLVREYHIRPLLIVGVPVGFVRAAESKDELIGLNARLPDGSAAVPYITAIGRKGGSSVAAAIVNALLRLAVTGTGGEASRTQ